MLLPPHPHRRHPRPHTHRHLWFPGQTYYDLSPLYFALIHPQLAMLLPPHVGTGFGPMACVVYGGLQPPSV
jgi:hypothetical protein